MGKSIVLFIVLCSFGCTNSNTVQSGTSYSKSSISCSDEECSGVYSGPEFTNGSDVAHQFSNKVAEKVGERLKKLYNEGKYVKVDFDAIEMETYGMGTGNVSYKLKIPFKQVDQKCDAYTSFDHAGGWDHKPALSSRKKELQNVLLKGEKLDISTLKTTPEGLQEYWIQWKNKELQVDCADSDSASGI